MPSPVYQYVVNLVVSLPIRRGPGVLMNVSEWEFTKFFDVAKLTILTPLLLLYSLTIHKISHYIPCNKGKVQLSLCTAHRPNRA